MDPHDSDVDGCESNNDEDLSEPELQDEDSEDGLSRLPVEDVGDPEVLAKLKQQEREEREEIERELKAHAQTQSHLQTPSPTRHSPQTNIPSSTPSIVPPPAFSLPLPFPFPHPVQAFLPPLSAASAPPPIAAPTPSYPPSSTAVHNSISSGSSHSSESSSSSQQTWSFEEQFKQVRQNKSSRRDPRSKRYRENTPSTVEVIDLEKLLEEALSTTVDTFEEYAPGIVMSTAIGEGSKTLARENKPSRRDPPTKRYRKSTPSTEEVIDLEKLLEEAQNTVFDTYVEQAPGITMSTPNGDGSKTLARELYEINDDPKRKEFLDDLFSYMQKRGTPINRLPIMAKSVLDLYELYNLVIARGGLVDVINKKLWQEIIKGLHLPSSITSAAFTLRTQYMKYLYPYECEKKRLSTPVELQAAIDGNRREGRRSSYGTYSEMVQRSPMQNMVQPHPSQMSPLSLVTSGRPAMNGNSNHHHPSHPSHPQPHSQPMGAGPIPGIAPSEFEARMADYVKLLHKEFNATTSPSGNGSTRQGSSSPQSSTSPQEAALNALGMSRLTFWNLCNNNMTPIPPPTAQEPQKEALNLEVREQQARALQESLVKRECEESLGPPPPKRLLSEEENSKVHGGVGGAHIKIASRGDGRAGMDNSLVVSMEINGIMYQGVLFAQTSRTRLT